jgi:hypothetical protein
MLQECLHLIAVFAVDIGAESPGSKHHAHICVRRSQVGELFESPYVIFPKNRLWKTDAGAANTTRILFSGCQSPGPYLQILYYRPGYSI